MSERTQAPGSDQPRDWYVPAWLDEAVALPSFQVLDTRSAQGRLDGRAKDVTMRDLILAHGHACDGLLRGAYALRALADAAFGDRPLDRSDLLVVSKNSPCLGDVAAFLTGGRARFGTHRLDADLGVGYVIQVLSTGELWEVKEEAGFFPALIADWEAALLDEDRVPADDKPELIAVNESAQWNWVRLELLPSRPADHYRVRRLDTVALPAPLHAAARTDVTNRSVRAPAAVTTQTDDAPRPAQLVDPSGSWERRYLDGAPPPAPPRAAGTPAPPYEVRARIVRPGAAEVQAKQARIAFDSSPGMGDELPGPAELLCSAFAACLLKNVERFSGMLAFDQRGAEVHVTAERQQSPPRFTRIGYTLRIHTDETPTRVALLHRNLVKHGTVFNTLAAACEISGEVIAVGADDGA